MSFILLVYAGPDSVYGCDAADGSFTVISTAAAAAGRSTTLEVGAGKAAVVHLSVSPEGTRTGWLSVAPTFLRPQTLFNSAPLTPPLTPLSTPPTRA